MPDLNKLSDPFIKTGCLKNPLPVVYLYLEQFSPFDNLSNYNPWLITAFTQILQYNAVMAPLTIVLRWHYNYPKTYCYHSYLKWYLYSECLEKQTEISHEDIMEFVSEDWLMSVNLSV